MKHYTILPLYKNNEFIDTWIYWYKQFVCILDYEVWSLIDYLYIYNPNYLLFNQNEEGASYFTKKDLEDLGLLSGDDSKIIINATKLLSHTGLINDYLQAANEVEISWGNNRSRPFKEAEIIIFNSTDTTQNTNPSKFLIGRLTAGNSFYIPYSFNQELYFNFVKNAEETYGNTQYFNLYTPRFNVSGEWDLKNSNSKGITLTNNFVEGDIDIKSDNALWTGHEQLNHNFYISDTYEDIITDSIQITGFVNKQNPYYIINIENEQGFLYKEGLPDGKQWLLNYYVW